MKVSSSEARARNAIEISESSASTPSKSQKGVPISDEGPVDNFGGRAKSQLQSPLLPAVSATSKLWEHLLLISKVEDCKRTLPKTCEASSVHVLNITDLSEITPRLAFEGKVLNNYGTFKMSDPNFPMYFKVDVVDKHSSDIITIVVGSVLINQFIERLPVFESLGLCLYDFLWASHNRPLSVDLVREFGR
ncbi:hypothetical protein L7F22_025125 [Adiantum nelumboides]|nr:hypothetical protein [Adiantum nelumboides]